MKTKAHAPTELIADYAAGTLPAGMRLLVASHLSYCPECCDKVARLEAIGGALLAEAEAVKPEPRCLIRALARIARPARYEMRTVGRDELPGPLRLRIAKPICDLRWRPILPGLSECRLDGFPTEAVGLMRAQPGAPMRPPECKGGDSRLVLSGGFQVGARTFGRGDLALPDPEADWPPEAVGSEFCLCLVVRPGFSEDAGVPRFVN